MIAGTAFLGAFGSVVFFNPVLGVFSPSLEEEFGWSRASIALAITLGSAAAAFASPALGWVIDRWGGRWVIAGSALAMTACLVALANMNALWQLLLFYAIGRALAVGAISPAAFVAVANWYVRRRAFVAGIVAVAPRAGMALFPVLVALVIGATGTWRAGWLVLAAIILLTGVPAPLLLMRRRPEDHGLLPDGDAAPADREAGDLAPAPEVEFDLAEAARTRAYWLIGAGMSLVLFAGGAVNFHQIPHLVDAGLPRTQAALVVTVFSGIGAVGAIGGGGIAARISVRWTLVLALAGMAGGVLLLASAATVAAAMAYAVSYGVFFGAMVALNQVVYADYFGRRSVGLIRGSFQPVQMGMNALGPFVTGLWAAETGSYAGPFTTFAVLYAVAAVALALSPYPRRPGAAAVSGAPSG